jgi:conjugative transfer signal peptidase TraF
MRTPIPLLMAGVSIILIAVSSQIAPSPRLVWNASASAPVGLYRIEPINAPKVGDLLAVKGPERVARFMAARGYLPLNALLLKRVAALSGTKICRLDERILIAGHEIARAKLRDSQGRPLPQWRGCRRLGDDALFLVNADVPDSLDGRYFGPFPGRAVVGLAHPIWIDRANDGRP